MPLAVKGGGVAVLQQLVVGGAGHDAAAEARNGVVVEDAAEGARGEDVALLVVDGAWVVQCPQARLPGSVQARGVYLGHDEARSLLLEVAGKPSCHLAEAL